MKYINEVRLRAEIERLKETHERNLDKPMERGRIGHAHGYVDCCDEILDFIDSLRQEQPEVDLGQNIEMEWDSFNKHVAKYGVESEEVVWLNWFSFVDITTHFYERGQKDAANKFDEIEYNRQRAEEKSK